MKVNFYHCDEKSLELEAQPPEDDTYTVFLNGRKQTDVIMAWSGENGEPGTVLMFAHHYLEPGKRLRADEPYIRGMNTPEGMAQLHLVYETLIEKGDVVIEKKTRHPREILEERKLAAAPLKTGRLGVRISPGPSDTAVSAAVFSRVRGPSF